ncbi:MAG: hypothetical protein MJY79_02225 [Bacteroidaceae bacterium]|nr:hypothetical protein [Bacteroidaceae bacterium]
MKFKSQTQLLQKIKEIARSLRTSVNGSDLTVFLLFLCLAFFFWWSRAMSDTYELNIEYPVELTAQEGGVRVITDDAWSLKLTVSGKGSALWGEQIRIRHASPMAIPVDRFQMAGGHGSLATVLLKDTLSQIMPQSITIRNIQPDSLVFTYINEKIVMVPVVFGGTTESVNQYFADAIRFSPDSVAVGISRSNRDSALVVRTENVRVEVSADTVTQRVSLVAQNGMLLYSDEVEMTVSASQYTEKSLDVPVVGINLPEGQVLRAFPSKARLVFWVRMADFDDVRPEDFTVVVDHNDMAGIQQEKVQLKVYRQPAGVNRVRIQPATVDFLIETTVADRIPVSYLME